MRGAEPVELRSIEPSDLAVAAVIHAACFDEAWSQSSLADLLAMPGSFGLRACMDGVSVGLIIVQANGVDAEILTLCVLPSHRRRAIATRLLAAARKRLSIQGVARLLLEVADDNQEGKSLYLARQFLQIGRRGGYYRHGRDKVDALILACKIG